jgi:4-hydroxy-2-oxoheptanedioate aldolase
MLRKNNVKKALKEGKTVYGSFVQISSPAVVEILAHAGFDFVIIDTEHASFSMETAETLVRAAQLHDICPVIRVTDNDPSKIMRALDTGAYGVHIPHVSSRSDAEAIVKAARYAPEGERGACPYVRAADYSAFNQEQYFSIANENTLVIALIEGIDGVNNIDEILSVPGIDVIFLGPYDLSQSLGLIGQIDHPRVMEELSKVISKAQSKNIVVGTFVDTLERAYRWQNLGAQFIAYSLDVGLLLNGSREAVLKLKGSNKF